MEFKGHVLEDFALFGCYTALIDSFTFRDSLLVPSSRVKHPKTGCPETSVYNYQSALRDVADERRAHILRQKSGITAAYVLLAK